MSLIKKTDKKIAVLIDPDDFSYSDSFVYDLKDSGVDYVFVGGTLVSSSVDKCISFIKERISLPVIIFPGDGGQVSDKADGLLFLSLLSGRNPEYLIGQHVRHALQIKQSGVMVLPTGYVLIDGGRETSVSYLSNTKPIPNDKIGIAVATAVAGELLGMSLIYLEAGSGAKNHVPIDLVKAVSEQCDLPIIVGGGIKSIDTIQTFFAEGANLVVIGTHIENNPEFVKELKSLK